MSDKKSQTSVTDPLDNATAEFNLTVAEDGLTVSGNLKYGILHNGEWHYDFAMHLLTVREDMAIDTQLEGQARLLESYAMSLDRLGDIPAEQISADILADGLVATDFDALFFAQELLAKKRLRPSSTATV
ncbi:hypothetical protein [Neisseria elongata]|uniref:hypothetical protein n=1 Tax=Neisseria elongata TaxID=495 RepID=UPI0019567C40|nr:hypothetical protein [Neisseria elongata]MBM7063982.1 hypothetical protein [Neisseria elongata]